MKQGYGSYSSRSIVMGGSAIVQAAGFLKDAIRAAAAKRLQCEPGDDRRSTATIAVGPNRASVALSALAADGISAEGTYSSNKRTYSYGAHAAHVAVDPGTGHVALIDYMAVEDVGRIINPLTLHGQTVGAIVQGLGGALLENLVYDAERPVPLRLARRLSAADRERLSRDPRACAGGKARAAQSARRQGRGRGRHHPGRRRDRQRGRQRARRRAERAAAVAAAGVGVDSAKALKCAANRSVTSPRRREAPSRSEARSGVAMLRDVACALSRLKRHDVDGLAWHSDAMNDATTTATRRNAEILIERARSLIPALRQRSTQATAERRLPQETIDDFRRLELTRCLQPAMFGGFGSDYRVFSKMLRTLAQGCGSSAWVAAVHGEHNWVVGNFPEARSTTVWDDNPHAVASASVAPNGTAEAVAGGHRLSGRWGFASGCDHAQWILLRLDDQGRRRSRSRGCSWCR